MTVHGLPRALVTGGAGFIGRHLVRRLIADGYAVAVIDDLSSGDRGAVPDVVNFTEASILDRAAIARLVADADVIFHLAAIASVEKCNQHLVSSHMVNLVGFLEIIDAARASKTPPPVIYASSAAIYGNRAGMASEDDSPDPRSPYGADKLSMELHARAAFEVHGQRSVGLRFFNVYGPEQNPQSPYSGVISIFLDRLATGRGVVIHGDGLQSRDFIHVTDVVDALMAAASQADMTADVFNVATGRGTTILQLLEIASDITGQTPVCSREASRSGDVRQSVGDPGLLRRRLGVEARVDLRSGLGQLWSSQRAAP